MLSNIDYFKEIEIMSLVKYTQSLEDSKDEDTI